LSKLSAVIILSTHNAHWIDSQRCEWYKEVRYPRPKKVTMKLPIYMDNQATTPMDPRVLEAMMPYFVDHFGNAASRTHAFGWTAEEAVDKARDQIATAIGAQAKEIVFTSGATESNNLAIKGAAESYREQGNHIITVATEHKAVLDVCKSLERRGFDITILPVNEKGLLRVDQIADAITENTILVSVMHANNEIGVVHPIADIGALCKDRAVLFHVDAAQSVGKIPFDLQSTQADLVSLSGHKVYGPKGIGALVVRRRKPRIRLTPLIEGGGHERGLRSGTLPVPLIVGFAEALHIAVSEQPTESKRLLALRNQLRTGLTDQLTHITVNGDWEERLPGNLNVSFQCVEGESLLMGLNTIAVSSGSACTSASLETSYVLAAMGVPDDIAHSSIRFGLGRFNTEEEIEYTVERVVTVVNQLRAMSPLWEMVQQGIPPDSVEWTSSD
jgi:cysteine desulfurase